MIHNTYFKVSVTADGMYHQLFPQLIGEVYSGSYVESLNTWELSVNNTGELDALLKGIQVLQNQFKLQFTIRKSPVKNWNEEWEKSLKPIRIPPFVQICMESHIPEDNFQHTIIIQPDNAFGTGHHHTTRNMLLLMKDYDFKSMKVLDLGCGTGILGILALKMGADYVQFIDNDIKAIRNTSKNLRRNGITGGYSNNFGTIEKVRLTHYDLVLANLYRSILIKNESALRDITGNLFLSGYRLNSEGDVLSAFANDGWERVSSLEENGWLAEHYFNSSELK